MLKRLTKETKKVIYWILITFGITLLLFLIIFNGAYWGINVSEYVGRDQDIVLSVMIPFLSACLCFTTSHFFYDMLEQEVRNQLDQQLDNGFITLEQWVAYNENLDKNLEKKRQAKFKAVQVRQTQELKRNIEKEKARNERIEELRKINEKAKKEQE